jgi:aryl-alcohol dehydrogenase-like predicted oxidoreductase
VGRGALELVPRYKFVDNLWRTSIIVGYTQYLQAMDHVLQAGLAAGMSATEGAHSAEPIPVDPAFDGHTLLPRSFIPAKTSRVTLRGKHGNISAPIMNIGAWSWGDVATWHWSPEELPAVKEAWRVLVANGVNWIDTAQAYGSGESERICGDLFAGMPRDDFIIQTKWYVIPNTTNILSPTHALAKMLRGSLERLRLTYVDVYLVHGPIHVQSIPQVAKGLAECVGEGLAKTIGVANYSKEDMIDLADELAKYGVPLATNQCEFSVLRRYPETHGLIKACLDRGIVFQSYSPLAQGRLTGKYTASNPPPKTYRFSSYDMKDIEPTQNVLRDIAKARGVSMSAVALNYNMIKGAVPTVGMRSPDQARQNLEALGWRLSDEELVRIDKVSLEGKATVLWQHG